jgi:Family of unknown function (DUF6152)
MAMSLQRAVFATAAALTISAHAYAHHSQVLFDMGKCLTISGTVRSWEFESPHSWLWIVVPNSKGSSDVWGFEASSPAQMIEREPRWKRDVVKTGDKVTVRYSPLKDGRTGGALNSVVLPDGTTLRAATPACTQADTPAPAPAAQGAKRTAPP